MASQKTIHRALAALLVAPLLVAAAPPARLGEALAVQQALVDEHPGDAGALNDLGNLLMEAGDLEGAESAYRRALEVDPARAEPQFNLALLLLASDRPRQARQQLRELLRAHPKHAWGHYQLGTLRLARGERSRALRSYREAFRLDPSLTDPRINPHIVDNELATAAMLKAFARIAAETSAPRIYADPGRITGLLLPPLTGVGPADEPEEEAPEMETVEVTGESQRR